MDSQNTAIRMRRLPWREPPLSIPERIGNRLTASNPANTRRTPATRCFVGRSLRNTNARTATNTGAPLAIRPLFAAVVYRSPQVGQYPVQQHATERLKQQDQMRMAVPDHRFAPQKTRRDQAEQPTGDAQLRCQNGWQRVDHDFADNHGASGDEHCPGQIEISGLHGATPTDTPNGPTLVSGMTSFR